MRGQGGAAMGSQPKAPRKVARVALYQRDEPEELRGAWCDCPRTGMPTRVERCIGCEHAVEFRRANPEDPHVLCAVEEEPPRAMTRAATTAVSMIMSPWLGK